MKLPASSVAWLLPFFLTACFHKTQQTQVQQLAPPIVEPPMPKPEPAPANLPPPVVTIPSPPPPSTASTTPPPAPKPRVRHKKPANKNPEEAANVSPGVSAIGELSSGDPVAFRQQTEDLIAATQRGLDGITRPLSESEQRTAAHIREFLKQAKEALDSGDVDGANTLAAKAKVLLGELTK